MNDLMHIYDVREIARHTRHRKDEQKLGEAVFIAGEDWVRSLRDSAVKYVLLGVAEDIGVRANFGRPGAASAFRPAVDSFLNQQANDFMSAAQICVLGELNIDDVIEKAGDLDPKDPEQLDALRSLVANIDERLCTVIRLLIEMKKVPIVIGGGHNNSYGNIKGAFEATGGKVNVINCDPHLDFRPLEGRHSGNGFSYAYNEGFVERYAVFGVHEQYNTQAAIAQFKEHPAHLHYHSFESIFVREEQTFSQALKESIGFVSGGACGIEVDLDAITNVPASARTSSGISALQARQFVHQCGLRLNALYLHVAEGAPVLSHIKADNKTGKLIAYLVTDFLKAHAGHGQVWQPGNC